MKRFILLSLVMFLSVLTMNAQTYYGRVQDKDGYSNIRSGPSTKNTIVRQYKSGDYLYYTPLKNGWSKVYSSKSSNSFMGYMHSSLIKRVNTNPSSSLSVGYIVDPEDNYVNVRRGPGTNYAISSRLDVGTQVYYSPVNAKWCKVYDSYQNYLGYVSLSRIR